MRIKQYQYTFLSPPSPPAPPLPNTSLPQVFAAPDSNALNPRYVGAPLLGQGPDKFDNAAATLLFTVGASSWLGGQ